MEAEPEYQQSLALYRSVGDKHSATWVLNNLAVIERERGDLDRAEGLMHQFLEQARRTRLLSVEETPYLLRAQAWLARSEGHADAARGLFAKALNAARTRAPEIVLELKAALRRSVPRDPVQRLSISRVRSSARGRSWMKAATSARMAACRSSAGRPSSDSRRSSP